MIKNIINEEEVFAINDDLRAEIVTFDPNQTKVVIIDNFYKNPELVRQLALDIPPTYKPSLLNGLPGGRIDAIYQLQHFGYLFFNLINDVYVSDNRTWELSPSGVQQIFESATFCVNVTNTKEIIPMNPHVDLRDHRRFAAGIFLNSPEECAGGTSFYTYKGKTEGPPPGTVPAISYITDSEGDWELLYLAEMKFNRLILYQQCVLHTAYVKPGMFDDNYRLMQMFFI